MNRRAFLKFGAAGVAAAAVVGLPTVTAPAAAPAYQLIDRLRYHGASFRPDYAMFQHYWSADIGGKMYEFADLSDSPKPSRVMQDNAERAFKRRAGQL